MKMVKNLRDPRARKEITHIQLSIVDCIGDARIMNPSGYTLIGRAVRLFNFTVQSVRNKKDSNSSPGRVILSIALVEENHILYLLHDWVFTFGENIFFLKPENPNLLNEPLIR